MNGEVWHMSLTFWPNLMRSKMNAFSFHSDLKTAEPTIASGHQMASDRTLACFLERP